MKIFDGEDLSEIYFFLFFNGIKIAYGDRTKL